MTIKYIKTFGFLILLLFTSTISICQQDNQHKEGFVDVEINSTDQKVEPMTGIVFWQGQNTSTDAISLEFSYMLYNDVVKKKGVYDWTIVEKKLNDIASRGHQAIFRFRVTYPGYRTSVPDYIKALPDYEEIKGKSEGEVTWFPDWRHKELRRFTLEFYQKFAEKYDDDPRIAFLQVGFGLWGEYHIYDGVFILGRTFPSKNFQEEFFINLDNNFKALPWQISIDAADDTYSPFSIKPDLLKLKFGNFDDSFMHKDHSGYNEESWDYFKKGRRETSPAGGEFSYYTDYDQRHVLDLPNGPHGISYEDFAKKFNTTYMIGNDQPGYQTMQRIKEASMASGYRFLVKSFKISPTQSKVVIKNVGVAPIYYDAYPTVNGVRSSKSLKHLLSGTSMEFIVESGGGSPVFTIECDRLVNGQTIGFLGTNSVSIASYKANISKVYPNIVTTGEQINIETIYRGKKKVTLKIYNSTGMLVDNIKFSNKTTLQSDNLIGGVYFLHFSVDNMYQVSKLVVK